MAAARKVISLSENELSERRGVRHASDHCFRFQIQDQFKRLSLRKLRMVAEEIQTLIDLKQYEAAQTRRLNAIGRGQPAKGAENIDCRW